MKKISCIIPAYNEEKNIADTLRAVIGAKDFVSEIIVIDDGSKDKTVEIVRTFSSVKLLVNENNLGKSGTIARGAKESTGDYVFMLDADLVGLNSENIMSLVSPIRDGIADVVISMRSNTPVWMKAFGFDSMSGERVLPRFIFDDNFSKISDLHSYGLEVFINRTIINNKLRVKTVMLANIRNNMKWQKSFFKGIKGELLMWRDIFKTVSFFEFVGQHFKIHKLLIK